MPPRTHIAKVGEVNMGNYPSGQQKTVPLFNKHRISQLHPIFDALFGFQCEVSEFL
jgi:hypothetical protein